MHKPSKVVCITEGRRKRDTDPQRSIRIREEGIATLHYERTSNRIDFFLTPLFATRKTRADSDPRNANVTVLPSESTDSTE